MHLGKALHSNNWELIRKDLNKRPIEGVNGAQSEDLILEKLAKYGIRKTSSGTDVLLWGTGTPLREFLFSDDLADACVFVMKNIDFKDLVEMSGTEKNEIRNTHINIGSGTDLSIKELSEIIKKITGFQGNIVWDSTKPDGTPQKLMDVSKLRKLGWGYKIKLNEGISMVYEKYTNY
jgi:GDP-L-fucose synthase